MPLTCHISQNRRKKTSAECSKNCRQNACCPMPWPYPADCPLTVDCLYHVLGPSDLPYSPKSSNQTSTASPNGHGRSAYCPMPRPPPGPFVLLCPTALPTAGLSDLQGALCLATSLDLPGHSILFRASQQAKLSAMASQRHVHQIATVDGYRREISSIYIYIYIYMCVCVCVLSWVIIIGVCHCRPIADLFV